MCVGGGGGGSLAQSEEHWYLNLWVWGSSPMPCLRILSLEKIIYFYLLTQSRCKLVQVILGKSLTTDRRPLLKLIGESQLSTKDYSDYYSSY